MATVEKPQPMDVDPKKAEDKVEEKTELVKTLFLSSHYPTKNEIRRTLRNSAQLSLHIDWMCSLLPLSHRRRRLTKTLIVKSPI